MKSKQIKTAIFPVAGLGTRLLPATKVMPKEMLPVIDMPLIQLAVDEAKAAGVENFIFVISNGKEMLVQHFDEAPNLMETLSRRNKQAQIDIVNAVTIPAGQLKIAQQDKALGLGHAVWCAREFISADESFAVMLPDDFIMGDKPCLQQMAEEHARTGHNIIASMEVPDSEVNKYGIVTPAQNNGRSTIVKGFVEKPALADAPSNIAVIGRYILSADIMPILQGMVDRNATGAGGEIQLTDAMVELLKTSPFTAYNFEGERFDCGHDIGFVKAQIAVGLTRPNMSKELVEFMIERLRSVMSAEKAGEKSAQVKAA